MSNYLAHWSTRIILNTKVILTEMSYVKLPGALVNMNYNEYESHFNRNVLG